MNYFRSLAGCEKKIFSSFACGQYHLPVSDCNSLSKASTCSGKTDTVCCLFSYYYYGNENRCRVNQENATFAADYSGVHATRIV